MLINIFIALMYMLFKRLK